MFAGNTAWVPLFAGGFTLITAKLMDGKAERMPDALPGFLYFIVLQYFGEDAAWEEMTAAPQATWAARRRAASAGAPG